MQDSREIDYFGQRILQIVQPLATGGDRREVIALLAESVANNFAADGCWILQYVSPGVARIVATACVSSRTQSISSQLLNYPLPAAPTPTQWRIPILPDYQVMVVETRDQDRVTGCLILATKGVEWYRETKLILQMVAEYVGVALIEEDLHVQAQISQIYPQLHHRLTQAIVENQPINQLFELAVSDMLEALQLKRGLVVTLKTGDKSGDLSRPPSSIDPEPAPVQPIQPPSNPIEPETSANLADDLSVSEWDRPNVGEQVVTPPPAPETTNPTILQPEVESPRPMTQLQIVTTIDVRQGDKSPLPAAFFLQNSEICQAALANAPNPTIFDGNAPGTSIDRLVFQADQLPSIAMIPLMGATNPHRKPADALWGWLVLQHDRSRHWHPVELKLLQCQIYQIALARIYRQVLKQSRTTIANRTSQVQTSLQLQAKLHEVSRKRLEKLQQANQLKDEFISTISHELRTPLTSMSLAIKMLRQVDVDPARRQQYLDILEDQCQREIKLVNDLLKLQQLESHQLEFRPQQISLNQFVSEQATFVADRWPEKKLLELSLHLPQGSSQLETDADSLKHIIEELLINAGKFALPQTMVEVWLTIESAQVIFQIDNLSKPISEVDLAMLFDRFQRGSGTTQQAIAGTGLGLALVKSMVEHIQGSITLKNSVIEPGIAKTSVTVIIPTAITRH
jgi:signal transduction histidine kinase